MRNCTLLTRISREVDLNADSGRHLGGNMRETRGKVALIAVNEPRTHTDLI